MTEQSMDLTIFNPFKATLAKLEERDESLVFDHTTPEGEKELRSWVKQLRGYKGDVARAHKDVKANALNFGRQVDAVKNELTAGADRLITARMKPLDEIEAKKRVEAEAILEAERVEKEKAEQKRLADLERREAEAAKKEAEIQKREQAERERQIAAEAAENARKEAERIASNRAKVAEQEKAEAIKKAEREKTEAVEAEKEKARKAEAERQAKIEAEKAEYERLAKIERERIENEAHRTKVRRKISAYLFDIIQDETITQEVVDAIDAGNIPNVTISY